MRESTIERAVCDRAKELGCMVVKLNGPGQRGLPDRMILRDGRCLFMEFKAPGKKPTALQEKWLRDLWAQQFAAVYVDSVSDGISALGRYIL